MGIALKKSCRLTKQEVEDFDLKPFMGRVIVKEAIIESAGLITLPKESQELASNEGLVIAVGQGVTFCSVGDSIYYAKYSGFIIERQGNAYRIMNEEDILGLGTTTTLNEEDCSWSLK